MNTSRQSPINAEISTPQNTRQSNDVPPNLLKSWQAAADKGGGSEGANSTTTVTPNPNDSLAAMPDAFQGQFLQEYLRQSFDAERGGAGELVDPDADAASSLEAGALDGLTPSNLTGRDGDAGSEGNAARAEIAEQAAQNAAADAIELDIRGLDKEDSDLDDEIEEIGAEDIAHGGRHQEIELISSKMEAAQAFAPRDATDYQWIEKFTDRVLIEVEARSADKNVSIQLANDVIPNALLTLSRANGRWQLKADTSDDGAANGIEDAEQVLAARFAARGLGEIDVDVSRGRNRSGMSAYA
jgi:hypothetical protein